MYSHVSCTPQETDQNTPQWTDRELGQVGTGASEAGDENRAKGGPGTHGERTVGRVRRGGGTNATQTKRHQDRADKYQRTTDNERSGSVRYAGTIQR